MPRPIPTFADMATHLVITLVALVAGVGDLASAQTVAQPASPWRPVGPTGAEVTVIAPDPTAASRIHVGTVGGNVYLTEDGGSSWSALGNGLLATTVAQIELPDGGGPLYARSGTDLYRWFEEEELWAQRPIPGNPHLYAMDLGRSPSNRGVLYALTANTSLIGCCSLWISSDEGLTWEEKPTGSFGQSLLVLDTEPPTLLDGGSRIYRSTDEGTTWFEATGPENQLLYVRQFFADPNDPFVAYALAQPLDLEESEFTGKWLLQSVDAGATWFVAGDGLPESTFPPARADLAVNRDVPGEVIFTSELEGAYRSIDGGSTFAPFASLAEQLSDFDAGLFAFRADGSVLGASDHPSDRPLAFAPQSSGPWSRPPSSFPSSAVEQVLPHSERSGDWIVRLRDGRLLRTEDAGATWMPSIDGLESRALWYVLRLPDDGDTLLAATTAGSGFDLETVLYRSLDGGDSWSEWSEVGFGPIREMVADPRRPGRLYALGTNVTPSISDDAGLSWSPLFEDPRSEPCQFVRDLAASPHEDLLIAGCVRDSGAPVSPPIYHSDFFVSRDEGKTWQPTTELVSSRPTQDAWSFSFDPDVPNLAYAALASGQFFRSTDGGLTWSDESFGDELNIRDAASRSGEVLVATVTRGVLRRIEPGVWQPVNDGLNTLHVRDLEYPKPFFGRVLAGTSGGGLHVLDRASQCLDDENGSCLLGRFLITAEWRDDQGAWHPAGAQQIAPGTGGFWFFGEQNLELAVKMIDGRGVNGHFWFYAGALSDVAYRIHIEDTATLGPRTRTYSSQLGVISSLADIEAFSETAPAGSGLGVIHHSAITADPGAAPSSAVAGRFPLTPLPPSLNLGDYRVTVEWRLAEGPGGFGFGRPLNELSAAFWFFEQSSLDLVFKILDGTTINGHDWLFVGSLTDVGFTLHVTHLSSGETRSYDNPPGRLAGFLDLQLGPKR